MQNGIIYSGTGVPIYTVPSTTEGTVSSNAMLYVGIGVAVLVLVIVFVFAVKK
jgi:hypothetical protein